MSSTPLTGIDKQRHEEALAAAGVPIEDIAKKKRMLQPPQQPPLLGAISPTTGERINNQAHLSSSSLYIGHLVPQNMWGMVPKPPKEASPELLERINSTTNRVNSGLDLLWGISSYGLSTMMIFHGQSTMFSFVSMWGAGTYLFALSQLRHVRGPEMEIWQGELQCVALWWLASFRQFREYRVLKWCGYSSWMGLGLPRYYAVR